MRKVRDVSLGRNPLAGKIDHSADCQNADFGLMSSAACRVVLLSSIPSPQHERMEPHLVVLMVSHRACPLPTLSNDP
jgi:hypothetical protein